MTPKSAPALKVLAFTLGNEIYALDVAQIKEVLPELPAFPPDPDNGQFFPSIQLRGQRYTLLDLRQLLQLPEHSIPSKNLILANLKIKDGPWVPYALPVDQANEFLTLPQTALEPQSTWGPNKIPVRGILHHAERLLLLLDPERLLN
jgi:chemotaxis signal transduction protein